MLERPRTTTLFPYTTLFRSVVLLAGDARGQPQLPAELLGGLEQGDHVPALGGADRGLQPGRSGADDGDLAAPTLDLGAEHQLVLVNGQGIDQVVVSIFLVGLSPHGVRMYEAYE